MIYCFKCPVCGYTVEQNSRTTPSCVHPESPPKEPWCLMVRDYKAESAQIDKFALRQDVRGTRAHRAEPMGPEEAHKANQERMSR